MAKDGNILILVNGERVIFGTSIKNVFTFGDPDFYIVAIFIFSKIAVNNTFGGFNPRIKSYVIYTNRIHFYQICTFANY